MTIQIENHMYYVRRNFNASGGYVENPIWRHLNRSDQTATEVKMKKKEGATQQMTTFLSRRKTTIRVSAEVEIGSVQ